MTPALADIRTALSLLRRKLPAAAWFEEDETGVVHVMDARGVPIAFMGRRVFEEMRREI